MIVLIGFVFGGGSPCMIVVSFVGLITRYVYFKYIFVRFCRVPKTYNEALNSRAITILKVILLIRCLISLYMYGANGIFAMEKSTFMKWVNYFFILVRKLKRTFVFFHFHCNFENFLDMVLFHICGHFPTRHDFQRNYS